MSTIYHISTRFIDFALIIYPTHVVVRVLQTLVPYINMAVMNTLLFIKMKKPPVHQQETLFKQLHQQSYLIRSFLTFELLSLRELAA